MPNDGTPEHPAADAPTSGPLPRSAAGPIIDPSEPDFGDASRRTFLAAERTYLAWWRSALAALAVSLGVGRILPALTHSPREPFVALGLGFALLGLGSLAFGTVRQRHLERAILSGRYEPLGSRTIAIFAVAGIALSVGTIIAILVTF